MKKFDNPAAGFLKICIIYAYHLWLSARLHADAQFWNEIIGHKSKAMHDRVMKNYIYIYVCVCVRVCKIKEYHYRFCYLIV